MLRSLLALSCSLLLVTAASDASAQEQPGSAQDPAPRWATLRRGLANSRLRFEQGGEVRVAFLGGSITWNPGWRDLVADDLRARFPDARFEFVNAGIPSFGSTPGAFRLHRDVLSKGRVDLLFVEAAVNDSTNGRGPDEMLRGMEGIVRHVRRAQPEADVVLLHFVDPDKIRTLRAGRTPEVVAVHERVAEHYGAPSLDLAAEVTHRIDAGEFTWRDDFVDLHPSPFGQRLYAAAIGRLFDRAWRGPAAQNLQKHPLPESPLDPHAYAHGRLIAVDRADAVATGFRLDPSWRPEDGRSGRPGFVGVPVLAADGPGAHLRLPFSGRAVGILVNAGPDAGRIEWRVDGGEWSRLDLWTRWSGALHLPWSHVLATGLGEGRHELEIRTVARTGEGRGNACRIVHFLVDGPTADPEADRSGG